MNVNNSIELELTLSSARMRHSRGVAEMATAINDRYNLGFASSELYDVGLYHDLAREWESGALLDFVAEHDLAVSEEEMAHPVLLHAPVGAAILEQAGMDRSQVVAVRHHTLGSSEMGRLGFALFCADYIEPNRTHLDDADRALLLEEETIEALCVKVIEREWQWREARGKTIARASRAFFHYLTRGVRQ